METNQTLVKTMRGCPECNGTGHSVVFDPASCEACDSTGKVPWFDLVEATDG